MKTLKYIAYLSLAVNIYVFLMWIYIYNNNYTDRKAKFEGSLPAFVSTSFFDVLIILLSIASVVYFARTGRTYHKIIMALQLIFSVLLVFQHL